MSDLRIADAVKLASPPLGRERPADAPLEFDSAQVIAMAGVSKRQLQWWDEQGYIRPEHRKHKRFYSPAQAALVIVTAELLKRGYTLGRCRKLRHVLTKAIEGAANVVSLKAGTAARVWLVTDGRRAEWIHSLDKLADFQRARPLTFFYLTPSLRMVGL